MIPRVLWHYARAMRDFNLPKDELKSLQLKRLRRVLGRAYDDVPYYHGLLRTIGKVPSDFRSLGDMRAIPLLAREHLVSNRRDLISKRASARHSRLGSGTSGQVISLAFDEYFRDITLALQARHLTHFGIRPWKRLVSVRAPKEYWRKEAKGKREGHPYTWSDELGTVATLGRISTRFVPLQASQDDPARDLRELLRLRPDFIMCPPSHLIRMSKFLPSQREHMEVEGMNLINEVFTAAAARRIEEAYGGRAFNSLGSNELGVAAADCAFQTGMHLNEDWILFEVLKEGEPVGEGEQGELVATVFSNDTMPLVRYATGDTVELADEGVCQCGSSMTRVRRVLGRRSDWIRGAGGGLIPPLDVAEEVEARFGMEEYQIVQRRLEAFEVRTADPDRDERRLSEPLARCLSDLVGTPVTLSFSSRPRGEIWLKNRPVVSAVSE